jgi:hypothetical protein
MSGNSDSTGQEDLELRKLVSEHYVHKAKCRLCMAEAVSLSKLCREHLEGYTLALQDQHIVTDVKSEMEKFDKCRRYWLAAMALLPGDGK